MTEQTSRTRTDFDCGERGCWKHLTPRGYQDWLC